MRVVCCAWCTIMIHLNQAPEWTEDHGHAEACKHACGMLWLTHAGLLLVHACHRHRNGPRVTTFRLASGFCLYGCNRLNFAQESHGCGDAKAWG